MPTWAQAADMVESLYARPMRARSTLNKQRLVLREFEALAESPAAVGIETIAEFVRAMHARKLAPATINSMLLAAKTQCNLYVAKGWIDRSPFSFRSFRVRAPRAPFKHLSLDEMRRILAQADIEFFQASLPNERFRAGRLRALVYVLAHCGLRAGEAVTIRWSDVDFGRHILWIGRNARTKTEASVAAVPMPPQLADVLTLWRPHTHSEWVFPRGDRKGCWTGGHTHYRPLGSVRRLGQRAGVEGLTMLKFRHSWATHAIQVWGLSSAQVQSVLRHTTPVTQEHYIHDDLPNLNAIARRVQYWEAATPCGAQALSQAAPTGTRPAGSAATPSG